MGTAIGDAVMGGASGSEFVLDVLSRKFYSGSELTRAEVLMGMTAAADQRSQYFLSADLHELPEPEIHVPESLKGALAVARV